MIKSPCISVIIPALNEAQLIPQTLRTLDMAPELICEIIVVDGGSTDATKLMAKDANATVIESAKGRGLQLRTGAVAAKGDWLLFLHADTRLGETWPQQVRAFIENAENARQAAYFTFELADPRRSARWYEAMVAWRCATFNLPYGNQGLLLSTGFYNSLGGFKPKNRREDVDMVGRIGRKRMVMLKAKAVTTRPRYLKEGYVLRPLQNLASLALYFLSRPVTAFKRMFR